MLASPISAAQVLAERKRIKSGSAAGPDGIRKACLVRWDPTGVKLARMFTGFLLARRIPLALKINRTTLIPKTKDKSTWNDVANWRPITIGSKVLRLFSSIMRKRLASVCPINSRQKCFTDTPGCSENLLLVEGALAVSKKEGLPVAMVFIDLAKAFVSHGHLKRALEQRRTDPAIIA